jgi:tRNA A-37 threonylcarbamoyl transferase component Bud32/tetratricopeptide (TPR) repeat protein
MKCLHCQTENPEDARYCRECGRSMQQEVICPHCRYKNTLSGKFCMQCGQPLVSAETLPTQTGPQYAPSTKPALEPVAFAGGRYQVKKLLGEGGRKRVYLVHDSVLDRDVAFARIKTEKLDENARTRIRREAQAMGRLGDHPNIVPVYDFGDDEGKPFMVLPLLEGGDVEDLIKKAPDHRLPLEQAIGIAKAIANGLVFAHSKGIIHRDLKPGNVWLSADGTAKIGDFGLAVNVDLSRLTESGMVVGTVAYMSPEQAMAGTVTPKTDLYSLGAMLYEMVTGRPPFVGETAIAVVGQHINTPPVSPAWHRADLPSALETLILQLLEKDPQTRPESASAVMHLLESVESGKIMEGKEARAQTENPIYRRVFVGREAELRQLQSAFDGAMSGQGSLMMVVGEPGIGKTALCEQLSTYVTLRGGRALVGHCYEEGSLSLPYLAFVEALRSYVLSCETKDLQKELGTGAADVARIISEVREKLKIKLRPAKDPEEERYRLMQAVTGFLTNASNVQPMLLVLEDLHDSDKGTLDMLMHISRHLAGTRILIAGTYRDVEVDRSHPLSAALAELRRVSSYGRVLLRGLNADEVRRMLESISRQEVPWGLAEAVHRQTEGNPLFVQEVVRYLAEEGLIKREDGRWRSSRETPLEMTIPEGLRDVIGKRLSLLSADCNRLLSVASVIGREFSLDILRGVANIDEEIFVSALKEAVQMSVLEERSQVGSIRYRFTHAFFRQTMYEELIAPQRLKLHQQVARSLETQYAKRLEEHAAELAEHFSQSTDPADLAKAVSYGEMAAQRAVSVYAYGEAVRLLEQALKVQRVLDPDDRAKVCDLLLALGDCVGIAGDMKRAFSVELEEAFLIAEAAGDKVRAARACSLAMPNIAINGAVVASWVTPEAAKWVERADRYAEPDTPARVWANIGIGELKGVPNLMAGRFDLSNEGRRLIIRNLDLARKVGDPDSFLFAAASRSLQGSAPQHAAERLKMAEELALKSRVGVSTRMQSIALLIIGQILLESGQRRRAEEFYSQVKELAERSGQTISVISSMGKDSTMATLDGNLEQAAANAEAMRTRGEQLGLIQVTGPFSCVSSFMALLHLGRYDEISSLSKSFLGPEDFFTRLIIGSNNEVSSILDRFVITRPGIGSVDDETPAFMDLFCLQGAVRIRHSPSAEMLLQRFAGGSMPTTGSLYPTCVRRHMGAAAALLCRPDEARKYYNEAIKVTTDMPFRPELALTRLQLAELQLEHYPEEKADALEHLKFAIKEFREMKMQPSLERAEKIYSEKSQK